MSALRWWAQKTGKDNIIARSNAAYDIPDRVYVTNVSKARELAIQAIEHISRALVDRIADAKLALGHSNATVNRTLELLRAILRKCVNDWEWLNRAPSVRMLKEPTRRIRFLTRDEARQLLTALPEHLADMAAFSLATGLRASNVTGMQWSQVDLTRRLAWIHPDQTKAGKAIPVPPHARSWRCRRSGRRSTSAPRRCHPPPRQ